MGTRADAVIAVNIKKMGRCTLVVRERGLEPLQVSLLDPKSSASASSATLATG